MSRSRTRNSFGKTEQRNYRAAASFCLVSSFCLDEKIVGNEEALVVDFCPDVKWGWEKAWLRMQGPRNEPPPLLAIIATMAEERCCTLFPLALICRPFPIPRFENLGFRACVCMAAVHRLFHWTLDYVTSVLSFIHSLSLCLQSLVVHVAGR